MGWRKDLKIVGPVMDFVQAYDLRRTGIGIVPAHHYMVRFGEQGAGTEVAGHAIDVHRGFRWVATFSSFLKHEERRVPKATTTVRL